MCKNFRLKSFTVCSLSTYYVSLSQSRTHILKHLPLRTVKVHFAFFPFLLTSVVVLANALSVSRSLSYTHPYTYLVGNLCTRKQMQTLFQRPALTDSLSLSSSLSHESHFDLSLSLSGFINHLQHLQLNLFAPLSYIPSLS